MSEVVYQALSKYYSTLEKLGYVNDFDVKRLLILSFYEEFVYNDYRGFLSRDDYLIIEKALNCLFGSTCLIPYPDYLKMGKLTLGSITELSQRVTVLEDIVLPETVNLASTTDNNEEQ